MHIVNKFWGRELWIVNDKYCGKILELNAGYSSSYHCHRIKQETFYCLEGEFTLRTEGGAQHIVAGDEPTTIYPDTFHSFESNTGAKILEVSTRHDEKDVVRKDKSHPIKMTYCFDIDGVICTDTGGDYKKAAPIVNTIDRINDLYDKGQKIVLMTARGTTTKIDWREATEKQLKKWGVKYHELIFGKPYADLYIDDKAVNIADYR
jgi:mannose-6-phosphate isomerase-like protein (cupin superfamily)